MGKIADRIAQRNRLFSPAANKLTVLDDAKKARHANADAALALRRRRATLICAIDVAKSMPTMERHAEMSRLADVAEEWGLKGTFGNQCNRTQCLASGAVWWNRGSYAYYCEDCAHLLNRENRRDAEQLLGKGEPLCVKKDALDAVPK